MKSRTGRSVVKHPIPQLHQVSHAMDELLEVSGTVDRLCKETPFVPAELLEARRSIHRAILALYDWADSVASQDSVSSAGV